MKASDPRLTLIAQRAQVKTPHVFHCWHAISENPRDFCPDSFAIFAGLERRHVDRIMATLAEYQLLPTRKARVTVEGSATRLPAAMPIPDTWIAFAQWDRKWDMGTVEIEFQTFLDYWHAQPGTKGVKLDWLATWRNWCRRSHTPTGTFVASSAPIDMSPEAQRARIADNEAFLARVGRS